MKKTSHVMFQGISIYGQPDFEYLRERLRKPCDAENSLKFSFTRLIESGVRPDDNLSNKRSVVFSNVISLLLCSANLLLVFIIPGSLTWTGLRDTFIGITIFLVPIFLNRLHRTNISHLYLCWVPPMLITSLMIITMKDITVVPTSLYGGLRMYLLATGCIPYLLLSRNNLHLFIIGILPGFVILIFCDPILDFFSVGHSAKGSWDPAYAMIQTRSLVAYVIIAGACLLLKLVVDKSDVLNQRLVGELHHKNEIIRQQAESELSQLNKQLIDLVNQLTKREIILERSQEIAKVGSWEFNPSDGSVFWSDQVYEIFGLDRSTDLMDPGLGKALFNESAPILDSAIKELVTERKSYDFTLQTRTPLGYQKWVRIVGFPLVVEDVVVAASGIVHDITVYKESEEQIRASEQNYRSLFEQASDAIAVTDLRGILLDVNTSLCNMLGYSKSELLSMNIDRLIDPEQLAQKPIPFDVLALGEHVFNERLMVRKDGSKLLVEANVKMFGPGRLMAIGRDVTARKKIESDKEKAINALNERVKELTTLHACSEILQNEKRPVDEVMKEIVTMLPNGWQFPAIASARIKVGEQIYSNRPFPESDIRQLSEFTTQNNLPGSIEIVYREAPPTAEEGVFLTEEQNLLDLIADMVRNYISRREKAEELRRMEANQTATINNTNFFIWSVNRDYEIISFNKPFEEFMSRQFGLEVKLGERLTDGKQAHIDLRNRWIDRYKRALAGEAFRISTDLQDQKLEYSLNPILEEGKIIGVSVIGQDVTERIRRENELLTVNKQLGELRLTALRSVMNPHFIFNSLNSIQYYILENDQKNAVTYLSTFSKLIRAILNNSLNNRVRLADELEMLRHYIQLEELRFENKFDHVIDVDRGVDIESVEIPSMLIQPYVENAILHGLYNKKDRGLLKISMKPAMEQLVVEIEDNGVGRKAASSLRQLNVSKHKSMGTTLTEERLRLINASGTSSVEIDDLETEGQPAGTLVRIYINV